MRQEQRLTYCVEREMVEREEEERGGVTCHARKEKTCIKDVNLQIADGGAHRVVF